MVPTDGKARQIAEPRWREIDPGELPARLRLLCVGSVEPSWVGLTLQLDARGCVEPSFNWVSTASEALTLLRDESFDCLLIRVASAGETAEDEPLSLARGIRAGGCGDPVVVVSRSADDETWCEALQLKVDLLVSAQGWESAALVPAIQRAIERGQMLRDIDRLAAADRRRLVRERDEASYLLQQQYEILSALEQQAGSRSPAGAAGGDLRQGDRSQSDRSQSDLRQRDSGRGDGGRGNDRPSRAAGVLPPEFDNYYQELVRTYVIMGSGSLVSEIARLADLLAQAGLSPADVLDFHLLRVDRLVRGLGNRSTRHVMARADLLALELMVHLGECYQRRWRDSLAGGVTDRIVAGGESRGAVSGGAQVSSGASGG